MLAETPLRLAVTFVAASLVFWAGYALYVLLVRNDPGLLPKSYVGTRWRKLTYRQRSYWRREASRNMISPAAVVDTALHRVTWSLRANPASFFFDAEIPDDDLLRDIDAVHRLQFLSDQEKFEFERQIIQLIENRRHHSEPQPRGPRQAVVVINPTPYGNSIAVTTPHGKAVTTTSEETPPAAVTYWDHLDG